MSDFKLLNGDFLHASPPCFIVLSPITHHAFKSVQGSIKHTEEHTKFTVTGETLFSRSIFLCEKLRSLLGFSFYGTQIVGCTKVRVDGKTNVDLRFQTQALQENGE